VDATREDLGALRSADTVAEVDARSDAADARSWAERRTRARARMRRPFAGRASAGEARAWRELRGDAPERASAADAGAERRAPDLARESAQLVGSAIHRALECLDLGSSETELVSAFGTGVAEALAALARELSAERRAELRVLGEALVSRIVRGPLLARLRALASQLVARELPVLLPASPTPVSPLAAAEASSADSAQAPLAYVSGAIDLLYRDSESGEWVVADYKTDQLPGAPGVTSLREHAERYRAQLERYGRAVAEALGSAAPPRLELWYLAHGERVVLEPGGPAAQHPNA
jgi:ATP-dependent exoDNAse (exonuclease V) beta subunit